MNHLSNQPEWGAYVSTQRCLASYITSIILTLGAFLIVSQRLLVGWKLVFALFALALIQTWIQLAYYFNLGKEPKPRWNLMAFYFMLIILFIITIGSMLIMYNLDYRMEM